MDKQIKRGFTCSTFDLLHTGHCLMLEEAKTVCDHLTVLLQTDPSRDRPEKHKPVQSIFERFTQLKGNKYVDEIIPYDNEEDLLNILKSINFDIRIIGEDYKGKRFTGDDLPIEVYYNKRGHNYSTSELRKRL